MKNLKKVASSSSSSKKSASKPTSKKKVDDSARSRLPKLLGWLVATLFILAGVYVLLLRRFTMLVRKFSSSVPSSSRRVVPSSPKKAIPTSPKMIVQLLTEVWITVMNV
ncbi:putative serine/threonine-protein kinase GCN2-like isoform X1 [Capsicum annuum]|nr:putative serine/threonine-protein kinase GCN2-like isoform X1 [Capsicum annuum]KAF3634059.1 putative serine/threonine-protein kinase GCN2-like isoform X1 [Capsicum annuum]